MINYCVNFNRHWVFGEDFLRVNHASNSSNVDNFYLIDTRQQKEYAGTSRFARSEF